MNVEPPYCKKHECHFEDVSLCKSVPFWVCPECRAEEKQKERLEAAAPVMLKALQDILNAPDYMVGGIARAAIAEATGEQEES